MEWFSSSYLIHKDGTPSFLPIFSGCAVVLFCLYMSKTTRNYLVKDLTVALGLFVQLFLLAIVSFTAATAVLCVFHSRIDQQGQQLSDLGATTGNRLASPLDFHVATNS